MANETVRTVPIADVVPWPALNPRTHFPKAATAELAKSIEEIGLIQPVVVKELELTPVDGGRVQYWLVAGERRYRASIEAKGVETIDIIVRDLDERTAHRIAGLENLDRNDLTAIEEARWLERELELNPELSQRELGAELGRSQSWVANRIRLLELPAAVQKMVDAGVVAPAMARDTLLRFVKLDKAILPKLWKAIVSAIKEEAKESSPVVLRDLRDAVAYATETAGAMRIEAGRRWNGQRYITIPEETLETFVAEHAGRCFRFPWGHGHGDALYTLAADEWEAIVEGILEEVKETTTSRGVSKEKLAQPKLGAKRKPMTERQLRHKFGHENVHGFEEIVDPTKIEPSHVVRIAPEKHDKSGRDLGLAYVGSNVNALKGARTRLKTPIAAEVEADVLGKRMDEAAELKASQVLLGLLELIAGGDYWDTVRGLMAAEGIDVSDLHRYGVESQLKDRKIPAKSVRRMAGALAKIGIDEVRHWGIGDEVRKATEKRVTRETAAARKAWIREHGFDQAEG